MKRGQGQSQGKGGILYLINATANRTLVTEYCGFVKKLHLCRARRLVQAGGLAVSNGEHREMVEAISSGNNLRAQESFFRHVQRSKAHVRLALERGETLPG